jgi:H+/Cl- antiporter ClcA
MGAFAIVAGTAFLASSMKMPITALVLMVEFTRVDHDFLVPMLCAVAGLFAFALGLVFGRGARWSGLVLGCCCLR